MSLEEQRGRRGDEMAEVLMVVEVECSGLVHGQVPPVVLAVLLPGGAAATLDRLQ